MEDEKLVAICYNWWKTPTLLRLIREVVGQDESSDHYAKLNKTKRITARELLFGYMLAWKYVEDLDGSGQGQCF